MTQRQAPTTPGGEDWYSRLTGVRSSRRTYYAEYRHTAASLDRSIRAVEPVSSALTTLTGGPQRLAEAVVRAAADIFAAEWAALAVRHPAFPAGRHVVVVPDGVETLSPDVPAGGEGTLQATIRWEAEPIGWLAVRMPPGRVPDDTDSALLRTLANQVASAIQSSWLFAESERLRAETGRAYDEMSRHARDLEVRNEQLLRARSDLTAAREEQVLAEERQRIARELHDTVAQQVLTIGMTLEWCRGAVDDADVLARLTGAKELARETVDGIRRAIFTLSAVGDLPPGGLVAALRRLTTDDRVPAGPATSLRVTGRPAELPPAVERGLYLIAREALFNAVRHAQARRTSVRLAYGGRAVRLSVSDDGAGDPAALRRHLAASTRGAGDGRHCGLANMAHRAGEMGSALAITRAPGGGVRVGVTVPLDAPAEAAGR